LVVIQFMMLQIKQTVEIFVLLMHNVLLLITSQLLRLILVAYIASMSQELILVVTIGTIVQKELVCFSINFSICRFVQKSKKNILFVCFP
jgi:hypothetical protein